MKRILSNRGLVFAIALLVGVSMASAASITQTETFGGVPNFSQTLTFDKFDDQGGTLTLLSVFVEMDMDVQDGLLVLDNDGVDPASGSYEFGGKANITSTDVSLLDAAFQPVTAELDALTLGSFSLDPNDGDVVGDFSPVGLDALVVNGTPQADADSGFIADLLEGQFVGTGTFDVLATATQWSDFGGVSGIEWAVTPVTANGSVTVTYNYIPEPATMSLLGIGGVAALMRRRRK